MTNKTRKRIWPVALMSLAVFGVLAAVVALSVMTPQTSQAHGCDDATSAVEEAECIRDHVADGLDPNAAHEHDPNVARLHQSQCLEHVRGRRPNRARLLRELHTHCVKLAIAEERQAAPGTYVRN